MSLTIIIVLIIVVIISSIWNVEKIGNDISSKEIVAEKIQHKLKLLRIWFWITFILGVFLFTIFIIAFKETNTSEPWVSLISFFISIPLLFTIPIILFVCIKRQKKQLIEVTSFIDRERNKKTVVDEKRLIITNEDENNIIEKNKSPNNQISLSELAKWQKSNLSDIIDDILFCKPSEDVIICYVNSMTLVETATLATNKLSPSWYIMIKWNVENFGYVNLGEDLCEISTDNFRLLSGNNSKTIKVPISGYFYSSVNFIRTKGSEMDLLCVFANSEEALIKYLKATEIEVIKDEFSQDIIVHGKRIAGSLNWCGFGKIQVNLENRMGEYSMLVKYARRNINIKKNDSLLFLFEDNSSISLNSLYAPIKFIDNPTESIIRYRLNEEHLNFLKQLRIIKWQIKANDGEIPSSETIPNYKTVALLFKYFVNKFDEEVKLNIPETEIKKHLQLDVSDLKHTSSCCYVYLMKDTANHYYKIGISNKPEYREKTLQSEKPSIELICCKEFPSRKMARALESALHFTYSEHRIRGEWFELNDKEVADIIVSLS